MRSSQIVGLNYTKVYLIIFILLLCQFISFQAFSDENIEAQQKAYNTQLAKYNQSKNELDSIFTEIRATEARLVSLESEKTKATSALEDIQRIDRQNPKLELSNKVLEAQERNRAAYSNYDKEEQHLKELQIRSISTDKQVKDDIIVLNSIARAIKQAHEKIIAEEVEKRITKFKKSTVVEGRAEVGCTDESPAKCQQRAKRAAERDASEKGSVMVIQSATNIENFKLTQDQIKTEVQAQLSNVEILEKGWIGDTTYKYRIRAEVTPIISTTLRQKIEDSISQELGIIVPEELPLTSGLPAVVGTKIKPESPVSQSEKNKTAAEKSFEELDRETGHKTTDIERTEQAERAKQTPATAKKSKADTLMETDDRRRQIFGTW